MRCLAVPAVVLALAGCGGDESALLVFAASSLRGVADEVDPAAEVVFGGSNDLAAQIRDGAEAGVFLSASANPVEELRGEGLVEEAVVFASNRLVLIVPADNTADVTGIQDLTRTGLTLVLGSEGVPVGDYARESLEAAGLGEALGNVVSLEADVKGIVTKIALGEADAGIVYATDVAAAGDDIRAIPISDPLQPEIAYYAAIVSSGSDGAERYLDLLLGAEGESALRRAGFLPAER